MQVAHLVSEAALTRGARQAFFDRADHTRRPVTDHQQRVRQPTPTYLVEELPAAVLLAARRRCGAEYDAAPRGIVDCGLWGRRGRPRQINGSADCRLRSDHRCRSAPQSASALGATHTLGSCGAEALAEIRKITGGGTDFALEASAVPAVFRLAVDVLRCLGTCILIGNARAGTEVSFAAGRPDCPRRDPGR